VGRITVRISWLGALWLLPIVAAWSANPVLGEIRLQAASRAENNAGVWLDGQYMGYLRELKGKSRLLLVPGEHGLLIKLAGYEDLESIVMVEPGERRKYAVAMQPVIDALYPDQAQTAKLRISVEPARAAVFVNGIYAGHVDRFDGHRGVRLAAGTYQFRITLPGYQPFETQMTLAADQDYEIKTELSKGSIRDQSDDLIVRDDSGI